MFPSQSSASSITTGSTQCSGAAKAADDIGRGRCNQKGRSDLVASPAPVSSERSSE
jgi:hypothetical protein